MCASVAYLEKQYQNNPDPPTNLKFKYTLACACAWARFSSNPFPYTPTTYPHTLAHNATRAHLHYLQPHISAHVSLHTCMQRPPVRYLILLYSSLCVCTVCTLLQHPFCGPQTGDTELGAWSLATPLGTLGARSLAHPLGTLAASLLQLSSG